VVNIDLLASLNYKAPAGDPHMNNRDPHNDKTKKQLEEAFLNEGGFAERLYWARKKNRQ
jgi:hypothetical protein